jgi:hypothetical protein
MSDLEGSESSLQARFGAALDRAETIYLRVLRAVILVIATVLIAYAGWLALSGIYKISKSPDSVTEVPAVVAADELTSAEMPQREQAQAPGDGKSKIDPEKQKFYAAIARRYYGLFRTKFEPYRQKEDKQLTQSEFDDSNLNTARRLEAVTKGELDFDQDKADLETLVAVMTEAAAKPETVKRLQTYQAAKRVQVEKKVQRTRTEYRRGWDSYSTACADWYYAPYGCAVSRPVQVPYTETVTAMEFPKGTQSHAQIFRAFQDRFFELLEQRRKANAAKAADERASIIDGNAIGELSLLTALQILGAFLALMFFFLLIAIERHQRRISNRTAVE